MKTYSTEKTSSGPMLQRTIPQPICTTVNITPAKRPTILSPCHKEADTRLSQLRTGVFAEPSHTACPCSGSYHKLSASLSCATKIWVEKVLKNLFHQNKVKPCPKYGITKDFQELSIAQGTESLQNIDHIGIYLLFSLQKDFHKKNIFT